jgi:DNA-binding NarL/FixJ family response regulator
MYRVLVACDDANFLDLLLKSFQELGDFEIYVARRDGVEELLQAANLFPDLIVLEADIASINDLDCGSSNRLRVPETQVFLVTETCGMETERRALSHGIAAVFDINDFDSIVMNARDVCSSA